jgi:hypothetical protein
VTGYGATESDWLNFDLLGLTQDLLPVVSNPNSPVSPKSSLKTIGKVPSLYNRSRQIIGIPNWTQHKTTPAELKKWSAEPDYGICLQTRYLRALDIDVADSFHATAIENFLTYYFPLPYTLRRRGNSPKFLLPFLLKGDYPKRTMKTAGGMIEFLGNGQQFVAIGTHPSGTRYDGLENIGSFPELTPEQFESLWQFLVEHFAVEPPSEASLRNPPSDPSDAILAALRDPVVAFLEDRGHVTGLGKEGQIFLRCPFESEHSEPATPDGTSTAYLPAGNRDYEQGHFSCLHAHCANRPDEDFLDAFGLRAADFEPLPPDENPVDKPVENGDKAKRFDVIPIGDFALRSPPEWLVKGILPEKSLSLCYGGSGDGKSFVMLDLMFALCRRLPFWNGHRLRPARAVYICAEGEGDLVNRINAYARANSFDLEALPFGIIAAAPNFMKMDDINALAVQVNAFGPVDLIVPDTLAQVTAGADENMGKDMGVALRNCIALQRLTSAAVSLVHHSGKDAARGARGWSGIKAPLDAEFCVSKEEEDGSRMFWVEKMKGARDGFGYKFKLDTVEISRDRDGDAVDSCVVNYLSAR